MPEHISWDESLSVQSKEIDGQHRQFFRVINTICDMLRHGRTRQGDLAMLLERLREYAFYHFATEEDYFDRFGYEGRGAHARQHDIFRARIREFISRGNDAAADRAALLRDIDEFARRWVTEHIRNEDSKCIAIFRLGNGLPPKEL